MTVFCGLFRLVLVALLCAVKMIFGLVADAKEIVVNNGPPHFETMTKVTFS